MLNLIYEIVFKMYLENSNLNIERRKRIICKFHKLWFLKTEKFIENLRNLHSMVCQKTCKIRKKWLNFWVLQTKLYKMTYDFIKWIR